MTRARARRSAQRTLAARRVDAPAGSYTARLFNDATLLRHKLLEEAQELAEVSSARPHTLVRPLRTDS